MGSIPTRPTKFNMSETRRDFIKKLGFFTIGAAAGAGGAKATETSPQPLPEILNPETVGIQIERSNAETMINNTPACLDQVIAAISKYDTDPNINPAVDGLLWYNKKYGDRDDLKPANILTLLKLMRKDMAENRFVMQPRDHMSNIGAIAETESEIIVDSIFPIIGTTTTFVGTESVNNDLYPSVQGQEKVPISNLDLLVLAFYEWGHRQNEIAINTYLQGSGYFKANPVTDSLQGRKAINDESMKIREAGIRFSFYQNVLQMGVCRSIATLLGNPVGKVIGLERHESDTNYQELKALLGKDGNISTLYKIANSLIFNAGY